MVLACPLKGMRDYNYYSAIVLHARRLRKLNNIDAPPCILLPTVQLLEQELRELGEHLESQRRPFPDDCG